jgi:hypothetical protein
MNVSAKTRYAVAVVILAVGAVALSYCSHLTGPALTATIESRNLVPTSTFPNASTLCCCRVTGTVRNTSSISAHLSLRFHATNAQGQDAGSAQDYLVSVPAGESRPYSASGIFTPCASISTVTGDVLVIGEFETAP